jgi:hypothetical protein
MDNFDTSSSGTEIELKVVYDYDLARMYFDDFLKNACGVEPVLQLDLGGRDNYAYIVGDISKPYYKKSQLAKMKKAELVELCEVLIGDYSFVGEDYTKAQLIDEMMGITIEDYYKKINEHYFYSEFHDKITHNWYTSRGYSQGDARTIIKVDGEMTESWKQYIDHTLWDSPIYFKLTVDGEEIDDNYLDDIYEYDKDVVAKKIQDDADLSDYVKEWVIDNLPDYPESNF